MKITIIVSTESGDFQIDRLISEDRLRQARIARIIVESELNQLFKNLREQLLPYSDTYDIHMR